MVHLNAGAIQIGDVRDFGQCRNEINFRDLIVLQQQFAEMNPLSTLVKENLIEIGRGQMAAFAEDFPQPPFLHSDTLVPGPLAESGRYSQAEGGYCEFRVARFGEA